MSASGWITMVLVLVVIWGGFLSLLAQSMRQRDE
jgi:hypothetical protein